MIIYDESIKKRALEHIRRFGPAPTHFRMAELTGAGKTVLELGCATGYVSELLARNGCVVTGVEIDSDAAKTAEEHCHIVLTGDLSDPSLLESLEGPFDVILCGDIIEHLTDPMTLLKRLQTCLKPGGYILVSLPNVAYWRMRFDLLMGNFDYTETGLLDYTHLRFFTVNSFYRFADKCGYQVAEKVINDAGFPGSVFLSKLPVFGGVVANLAIFLGKLLPNMFAFHTIYKLVPRPGGDA